MIERSISPARAICRAFGALFDLLIVIGYSAAEGQIRGLSALWKP